MRRELPRTLAPVRAALLALLVLSACRDVGTRYTGQPQHTPECGDGVLDDGEDCDGSAMGDATCVTLGFEAGEVTCTAQCTYSTALCVRRCGNGVLDLDEACDGALGVPACTTWGFNECTDACAVSTAPCLATQPFSTAPETSMAYGGPAILGDLYPAGPGDLIVGVASRDRVELIAWSSTNGFVASTSRKISPLDRTPRLPELLDANADGISDLATINADGAFDLLLGSATSYTLQPLDAGCAGATFIPSNGAISSRAIAVGCETLYSLSAGGVTATSAPALVAAGPGPIWADATSLHFADGGTFAWPTAVTALNGGDLDGDGDEDVAALTANGVELFENTGTGFASHTTFTGTAPGELRVIDVDGDGALDVLWVDGEDLLVRRNNGGWSFAEKRTPMGTGTRRSLAVGDADGDGDLDVAVTFTAGGEATVTRVFLNRVR